MKDDLCGSEKNRRGQSWRFPGDSGSDFETILRPRIAIKIVPTLTTPSKTAIMAAIMIPIMNTIMGWGRIACQNRDYLIGVVNYVDSEGDLRKGFGRRFG